MAFDEGKDAWPSPPEPTQKRMIDPILRNALHYSVSKEEYDALQKWFRTRAPRSLPKSTSASETYPQPVRAKDEYVGATVRGSLRIFIASQTALQLWDLIKQRVLAKGGATGKSEISILKSPNLRLSLSLSTIFLLHRLLHRFFLRLRTNLLSRDAAAFRRRNPRVSRPLTSRFAPAIGASLAGFVLSVYPADQLRITIAIYFATRSLEFLYNALEGDGWFKGRPAWWGSWMLTPLATGQLLYAFVFDRDCVPPAYTDFILNNTPIYVQKRPLDYPAHLQWPSTNAIVDGLKEMSNLNWPPYISPILFPNSPQTLPSKLTNLSPITSPAHPAHTALSCATSHPSDPSCTRTSANYFLTAFPTFAKFFAAFYALFSLPRYRKILADPTSELGTLVTKVLRTTTFVTGAIGTTWGSICLSQYIFPRTFLPKSRWFLVGALGGMWAYVDRQGGRGQVMYNMRTSIGSVWKVGKKRGWWKGVQGGDVAVFVFSLALMNVVYEWRKDALDRVLGKGLGWMRGEDLFAKKVKDERGKAE